MKKLFATALLLVLIFTGCSVPVQEQTPETPAASYLSIHFIDVDQADCALLVAGDTAVLIDAGRTETGWDVLTYLKDHNVEDLDLMVVTHPHGDHLGGIPAVLQNFPTEELWTSHDDYDTSLYRTFKKAAASQGLAVSETDPGTIFEENGLKITVIGPLFDNETYTDLNDTSLVLMVEFGQLKFLFTGDMESYAEQQLVNNGIDLDADVLKVGHHGSYSSTSQSFLDKVTPDYGIICCGWENEYGHPHDAPMNRLKKANVALYRTDMMGNIVLFTDGSSINFTTEMNRAAASALTRSAPTAPPMPTVSVTPDVEETDTPKSTKEIAAIVGVSVVAVLIVAGVFVYIFKKK